MREILFRGKNESSGEWLYGYYCVYRGCSQLLIDDCVWEIIDEKTVNQYIGLTDKNGVKIFEGDICRFREWSNGDMCWIGKVHYEHQQFVISGEKNKECATPFTLMMSRFISENIEVIGNIYDNPELINEVN